MEPRLSLITLGVADVARSRRFYEALGWRASGASRAAVTFFQLGAIALSLWGRGELARDAALPDPGGWGGVALAHNARTRAADPDGHPWEVAWNPHFPLRSDGGLQLPD
jgi:hypothetical protein